MDALGARRTHSGAIVTPASASSYSDLFACVRVIAETAASLPLQSYRREASGGRERVRPLYLSGLPANTPALLQRPAAYMTPSFMVNTLVAHLVLWGNAYVAKFRTNGAITSLGVIHPSLVGRMVIRQGEPYYTVNQGGVVPSGEYNRRDVLHFKGLSFDGYQGVSVVRACAEAIGLGMSLQDFAATWLDNSAHLGLYLKTDNSLTSVGAERLKDDFNPEHRGVARAGDIAIFEEGLTPGVLPLPARDAQFIEQRQLSATEMARITRVPPHMVAAPAGSSMTYANIEQADLWLVKHTVRFWLVCLEDGLKADLELYPEPDYEYPEFLMDAVLRADSATRASVYKDATGGKAWLTVAEARERENLTYLEGTDELAQPAPTPVAPPPDPNAPPPDPNAPDNSLTTGDTPVVSNKDEEGKQ